MKKSFFCLFAGLFLFFDLATGQNIAGTWSGVLKVMGTELHLVFHFVEKEGVLSGTMDSPDQHATGIPLTAVSFGNDTLHVEAANGVIVYKAKFTSESTLEGTFKQNGAEFPLVLSKGAPDLKPVVRPQEPAPPFPYIIRDVEYRNEKAGITLAGTLTLPEGQGLFPAAVLITGSGAQDRDETLFDHKPFWVIADHLTRNGIAVLRSDDRGTAKSGGDFATATSADFATDVASAVAFLRTQKMIDTRKIGLIGHSEGGLIAPIVASEDPAIDFIVLLAGTGVNGAGLLVMQNEAIGRASGMTEPILEQAKMMNETLYRVAMQEGNSPNVKQKMEKALLDLNIPNMTEATAASLVKNSEALTSSWMLNFLKTDPATYLEKVKCPVLAVGGSKDLQVPAEVNLNAIKNALEKGGNNDVTTKIFADLNHLFQHATTGLPNEYGEIEETFSPEVLAYMTGWIKER